MSGTTDQPSLLELEKQWNEALEELIDAKSEHREAFNKWATGSDAHMDVWNFYVGKAHVARLETARIKYATANVAYIKALIKSEFS